MENIFPIMKVPDKSGGGRSDWSPLHHHQRWLLLFEEEGDDGMPQIGPPRTFAEEDTATLEVASPHPFIPALKDVATAADVDNINVSLLSIRLQKAGLPGFKPYGQVALI